MKYFVGDFLDDLERELAAQRRLTAQHVDRAEALAAMRSRALTVAAALNRPITVEDVFNAANDERERAELNSLVSRITQEMGGEPAYENDALGGPRSESAEGL